MSINENLSREELIEKINLLETKTRELSGLLAKAEERLKKERDFLFSLIDGIPAYIYLQAKDYSIHYANKVFGQCYGSYHNKPCYKAMHNLDAPCKECKTFIVFETKQPQQWISYNWQGAIFHIYDYPFIDENGELLVLEMGIDITEQQKYEDSRLNLFANVSHELRSPLAKIMGYTEALRDNIYQNEADYKKLNECIYTNSVFLNKLIGDLFELSKLETAQVIELKEVALYPVILNYCEEQEFYFNDKNKKFSYSIDQNLPLVKADTSRIIQVLGNIIDNAMRYTDSGDCICLKAYYADKYLYISISDTGCGIAQEDIKYIFTRLYQGLRKVDTENHTGLGLNICKTIIDQHNGKIWVESQEGEGTTFFIGIPEYIKK